MTLGKALSQGAAALAAAGIGDPRREARLLLAHATGLDPAELIRLRDETHAAPGFAERVARRAAREPMALILGRQGFWTIDLAVSPDTLIPRADSEALIEAALAAFPHRSAQRILDLGTGTGCLLLAALTEFTAAWGVGVDLSPDAASLARRNATALHLADRASIVCGHWADAIGAPFDLVFANPPYIASADIAGLQPEVALHEPRRALDGGPDGLNAYRAIIPALPALLSPEGIAILELGAGQAAAVSEMARAVALLPQPPQFDYGGVARALTIAKKPFGGRPADV